MLQQIKVGDSFGRLTVLVHQREGAFKVRSYYICRCSCGNTKTIRGDSLTSGAIRSCGCLLKESTAARFTLPDGRSARNRVIMNYSAKAKHSGLPFTLSRERFMALIVRPCVYCGASLGNCCTASASGDFLYTGLDRLDSTRGYEEDNVVPCCTVCNLAKRSRTRLEFMVWIDRVYNYVRKPLTDSPNQLLLPYG
jgi:hypothetical protein